MVLPQWPGAIGKNRERRVSSDFIAQIFKPSTHPGAVFYFPLQSS
jgi:hypothetical protein